MEQQMPYSEERQRTAIHEAAHAVIAERLGVRAEGFATDPVKHVHYAGVSALGHTQFEPHTIVTGTEMVISLAGGLAEAKMFGDCPEIAYRGDMDTMRMILWRAIDVRLGRPELDPAEHLPRITKGEMPEEVESAFQKLADLKNQETIEMLNDPQTWLQIQQVAEAILSKGNLSGAEIRRIMQQRLEPTTNPQPNS